MLLLPEDEAGQVLEPSKTKCRLGNVGALDMNVLSLFSVSGGLRAIEILQDSAT
jgi:hypothetical protein